MAELQTDPFVSTEPEVELDNEMQRFLEERIADPAPLIPAAEAREQIKQWLTNFSTNRPL
jgi:hypothetical protein